MKKRILIPVFATFACLSLMIVAYFVYAWYLNVVKSDGAVILSEPLDGLTVRVYRGYDYDLDGSIDEHLVKDRDKKDMNGSYSYLTETDEVTEIIDNNYITYRLVISNESSYELFLNPYFMYEEALKQYSLLYSIDSISIYNHTMRNQDGTPIIDYNNRAVLTDETFSGNYKEYSLTDGLYDTYGEPIYNITDGATSYEFAYDYDSTEKIYSCTSVKKNGTLVANESVDLTSFYISDIYDNNETRITSDTVSNAYTKSGYEYNYLNTLTRSYPIEADSSYNYYTYPSTVYLPNKTLNLYMHEETYSDEILLESYSEYYVDVVFKSSSSTQGIYSALMDFVTKYNGTKDTSGSTETYTFTNQLYQDEYDLMEAIYIEKTTNSTLAKFATDGSIPFRIKYFCYDVTIGTEYESYEKPAYEVTHRPEVDI